MRTAPLAAGLAVAISSAALAAWAPSGGLPQFPGTPTRAHVTLGPVQTLVAMPAGTDSPAVPLADMARDRYGRIDALARVRTVALPFADAALVTGVALRWD